VTQGVSVDALREGLESIEAIRGEWKMNVSRVTKGQGRIAATYVSSGLP